MRHGRIDSNNIRELSGTAPTNGQVFSHDGTKNYWGASASTTNNVLWLNAAMMGSASNSVGIFTKTGMSANPNSYANPITSPYANYNNGALDPFKIPFAYTITEVHCTVGHIAVNTGTVGSTPTLRIEFFNHTGTTRSSIGSADVPMDNANCQIYNNLGSDNFQHASLTGLSISGTTGDILGWQFTNRSTTDNEINAIGQCTIMVKIEEVI